MSNQKQNAAELFNTFLQSYQSGALDHLDPKAKEDMLAQKKAECLRLPVYKEGDENGENNKELNLWFDAKKKGLISEEEYKARANMLLNPNKASVNAPVPNNQQKGKFGLPFKKKGCGCFTMIVLVSALGLYSLIPSCGNNGRTQTQTRRSLGSTIRQQMQVPVQPTVVEQILNQGEEWRSELTSQMQQAGLDEKTQQLVHNGMSKLSAYNEWLAQHAAEQADGFA